MKSDNKPYFSKEFIKSALPGLFFLAVLWFIKGLEFALDIHLYRLGIYPNRWSSITGIITAPLVHGDLGHLGSNSLPLLVLLTGTYYFYRKVANEVIIYIYVVTGIWVWLFAVPGYHIGASGIIYGLASFLFFSGVASKKRELLALSLLVVLVYGSMVWGLLPFDPQVSWQSHLFGAIMGGILAFYFNRKPKPQPPSDPFSSTLDFKDFEGNPIKYTYSIKNES